MWVFKYGTPRGVRGRFGQARWIRHWGKASEEMQEGTLLLQGGSLLGEMPLDVSGNEVYESVERSRNGKKRLPINSWDDTLYIALEKILRGKKGLGKKPKPVKLKNG